MLFGVLNVLMLWGETVFGGTLLVPSGYDTIQAAIDASVDGDVVTLADGTYTGEGNREIDFGGKAITVQSENGPAACILSGGAPAVEFSSEDTDTARLEGFTIIHGPAHSGTGILCMGNASPVIRRCIITDRGANGVKCGNYASPTFNNCIITRNGLES